MRCVCRDEWEGEVGEGGRDTDGGKQKERENLNQKSEGKKIIRLADSKCQHREGEQMEGGSCTHRHTNTGREGRERSIQKETGGAAVMETPLLLPPGGRNTIFLVLRGKTLPGRHSQFPTGGRQSCQGQEGES